MSYLDERAEYTNRTLARLKDALCKQLGDDSERILREDTCIYVVGSGGRGEMLPSSDIDLFIARVSRDPSEVDAFQVRQAIARALYELKFPDPSQGGAFLKMHTASSLCEQMGTPADDATNTLTARMLLLLESKPLLGEPAYEKLLRAVVEKYWQNASEHARDYQPFVLVNDIVRYWRVLLLNYVAKNFERERKLRNDELTAERRLRSHKLRFSRCATCFSAPALLLETTGRQENVTQEDVFDLVRHTPMDRLRAIGERNQEARSRVDTLLDLYETFLTTMDKPKADLLALFKDDAFSKERSAEGRRFGDEMFELLHLLGRENRGRVLFRHMVV